MLQMNAHHRDIWKLALDHPQFFELFSSQDVDREIQRSDRLFVNLVLLNAAAAYRAVRVGALLPIEGLERDIGTVFTYPVVASLWEEMKQYHDHDFVVWVDECAFTAWTLANDGNPPEEGSDSG